VGTRGKPIESTLPEQYACTVRDCVLLLVTVAVAGVGAGVAPAAALLLLAGRTDADITQWSAVLGVIGI